MGNETLEKPQPGRSATAEEKGAGIFDFGARGAPPAESPSERALEAIESGSGSGLIAEDDLAPEPPEIAARIAATDAPRDREVVDRVKDQLPGPDAEPAAAPAESPAAPPPAEASAIAPAPAATPPAEEPEDLKALALDARVRELQEAARPKEPAPAPTPAAAPVRPAPAPVAAAATPEEDPVIGGVTHSRATIDLYEEMMKGLTDEQEKFVGQLFKDKPVDAAAYLAAHAAQTAAKKLQDELAPQIRASVISELTEQAQNRQVVGSATDLLWERFPELETLARRDTEGLVVDRMEKIANTIVNDPAVGWTPRPGRPNTAEEYIIEAYQSQKTDRVEKLIEYTGRRLRAYLAGLGVVFPAPAPKPTDKPKTEATPSNGSEAAPNRRARVAAERGAPRETGGAPATPEDEATHHKWKTLQPR